MNAAIPDVDVEGKVGRSSSFEVKVDGKYVAYSKLASGSFPDFKSVAAQIAEYAKTGAAPATWKQ